MVAIDDIQEFANRVAAEFRPRKIILFGSHAYGRPSPDSDVDLLVILPHGGDPLGKGIEIRCAFDHAFPLDVIVRSPEELQWRLSENDWFTREIVEKGRVLYEAQHE